MTRYPSSSWNCTSYPSLEPNTDISGLGVLSAFLGTAYLTLICCIAKVVIDHKRPRHDSNSLLCRWSFALRNVIVALSDQQVVTGISIIISGLSQLQSGIQLYHWQSIFSMAWFSTSTHLITLTVLRDELRSNKTVRLFRLVGMTILVLMLVCILVPIGYTVPSLSIPSSFPVWCLYQPNIEWDFVFEPPGEDSQMVGKSYNYFYVAAVLAALLYCFVTRVLLLFYQRIGLRSFIRRMPCGRLWKLIESFILRLEDIEDCAGFMKAIKCVVYKLVRSLYVLIISGNDMYGSRAWEITWLAGTLMWGMERMFLVRGGEQILEIFATSGSDVEHVIEMQNVWGFGQVLSLALLVLPLASLFDAFYSDHSSDTAPVSRASPSEQLIPSTKGFFQVAAERPHSSLNATSIGYDLYANPCYGKLLWLWYISSLEILVDVVVAYQGFTFMTLDLKKFNSLEAMLVAYACHVTTIIVLLWLWILIFTDPDLQRFLKRGIMGRMMRKKPISIITWTLLIIVIVAIPYMVMASVVESRFHVIYGTPGLWPTIS